jgi:peptidoglycan/LPS O-acetylase OafA/YrhL
VVVAEAPRNRKTPEAKATGGSGFRADIQALRALAVLLVVGNHLWPVRLTGGYVGVDVFFVISGFLITSHLSKELFATRRVRLRQFYARRARRLLPAALTVLGVSLVAAWLWLPYTRWSANAQEIVSSAFYVENWVLAAKAVNYSAMNSDATMVQHYWSLSVEEQFYLIWPLMLITLCLLAGRRGWRNRRVLLSGLGLVTVASFCFSVYLTAMSPSEAYFNLPVRAWEFGAGAILALSASVPLRSVAVRSALSLLGVALILASAFGYNHATPFPSGTALVPVIGTFLVIWAGAGSDPLWHNRIFALRPVQFLGNISYSLYLWHWPLIVVAPFTFNTTLGTAMKALLLGFAVLLAWLTKRFIEDPWILRHRAAPLRSVLVGVAAGMLVIALGGLGLHSQVASRASAAAEQARADAAGPCFGPAAIELAACTDPFNSPVKDPHMGSENEYWGLPADCRQRDDTLHTKQPSGPAICDFADGEPAESVWLVGDSHAQQWQAAIVELAREKRWNLKVSYSGGCPLADVPYVGYRGAVAGPESVEACALWRGNVADFIERDAPAKVFTSTFTAGEQIDDGSGRSQLDQYKDGFSRYWKRWADSGAVVYAIADPPLNDTVRDRNCLAVSPDNPLSCRVSRVDALPPDPIAAAVGAASEASGDRVRVLDMSNYFCDSSYCYPAVGGLPIYFDADHLNKQLSIRLAPMIKERL